MPKPVYRNPVLLSVRCSTCGKPLVLSVKQGMFCEDMCGYDEQEETRISSEDLFDLMFPDAHKN